MSFSHCKRFSKQNLTAKVIAQRSDLPAAPFLTILLVVLQSGVLLGCRAPAGLPFMLITVNPPQAAIYFYHTYTFSKTCLPHPTQYFGFPEPRGLADGIYIRESEDHISIASGEYAPYITASDRITIGWTARPNETDVTLELEPGQMYFVKISRGSSEVSRPLHVKAIPLGGHGPPPHISIVDDKDRALKEIAECRLIK